jgi:hypothetical protein
MKKIAIYLTVPLLVFSLTNCNDSKSTSDDVDDLVDTSLTDQPLLYFDFPGVSSIGWDAVYIAWLEDVNGNNIQNLYVCNSIIEDMTTNTGKLTGDALPYWRREKSEETDLDNLDGISGASTQSEKKISRILNIGDTTKFKVCFEIDRSKNGNDYFYDRPCFIYESDFIDLSNLAESYELSLKGFMANDTQGSDFGQTPPLQEIPGFEVWKFIEETNYLKPIDLLKGESEEHSNIIVRITL